jgi:RNA polymerase sigma factor (TIGR02999 family)
MSEISRLIDIAAGGDRLAAAQLIPLVYDELRVLAAVRLAAEPAGQTLQPTALVHEAYLRLVGGQDTARWDGRSHFFAAAAEAMRRILVENARRKNRDRHGGGRRRVGFAVCEPTAATPPDELLALDEALTHLAAEDTAAAAVAQLHLFSGLSIEEVATALGISRATAYRQWTYARAYLRTTLSAEDESAPS